MPVSKTKLKQSKPSAKSRQRIEDGQLSSDPVSCLTPLSNNDEDAEGTQAQPLPKRKRHQIEKGGETVATDKRGSKIQKKQKKQKKTSRSGQKRVDSLFLYDEANMETPRNEDMSGGYGSLQQYQYHRKLLQTQELGALETPRMRCAPPPGIPKPYDDDEKQIGIVHFDYGDNNKKTRRKKAGHPPIKAPEPVTLLTLPLEVKNIIYRNLLYSESPINVYGGWKLVYKRGKPELSASILTTCSQIHAEATCILYGENNFQYRLRDPNNAVEDVQRLAKDDTVQQDDDDNDSGSDWEETQARPNSGTRRRRGTTKQEYDINTNKYLHLFRNITVEAEHNRYLKDTQDSMAKALKMFVPPNGKGKRKQRPNISTLTIRVSPRWDLSGGEDSSGCFTFVDFFHSESPVMEALKVVECRFLRIDLVTRFMATPAAIASAARESGSNANEMGDGACRLRIDMRHLRIRNSLAQQGGKDDWWAKDREMIKNRHEKARRSRRVLGQLHSYVSRACTEHNFRSWTTCSPWEFSNDQWDDLVVFEDDV